MATEPQTDPLQAATPELRNIVEEAMRTGWIEYLAAGDMGIGHLETACTFCGCIVKRELKDIHRLGCSSRPA